MPIIVGAAACPSALTAVATRMRCTINQATPSSAATSLIARCVAVTAALTLVRSLWVSRDASDGPTAVDAQNNVIITQRQSVQLTCCGISPCSLLARPLDTGAELWAFGGDGDLGAVSGTTFVGGDLDLNSAHPTNSSRRRGDHVSEPAISAVR